MNSMHYIGKDDFRVPFEKVTLYISLSVLAFVLLVSMGVSFGLILVIIGLAVAWVKIRQGQLLGQCVKVSANQLPDVFLAAKTASERLSMRMPDVFVRQDPTINAYALGFIGKSSVVLHSSTVESMTGDELISILGHEFSHIKCDHTTWTVISSSTGAIKIPLISDILNVIFLLWSRKAEYTCDRGGLIACRDLKASIAALAKVAVGKILFEKLNMDHLLNQIMDIDQDPVSRISETLSTHPYIVHRIHALKRFFDSPQYRSITNL
jgi:Zn-dependent protease with chaperone function